MTPHFESEVYGKWILSGEHAVLRGAQALVFPVFQKSFQLRYFETPGKDLEVRLEGAFGEEMRLLFLGVLEKALKPLEKPMSQLQGRFEITNNIPVGAGMGASAALCVGVAKWLCWKGWVNETSLYSFATDLENLFHGESSGVDIAVALAGHGLLFKRGQEPIPVQPSWQPHWYLSYCGQKGLTSVCVEKVRRIQVRDPGLAEELDHQMARATHLAFSALQGGAGPGGRMLKEAMDLALSCFERWGLVESDLRDHIAHLKERGALAVKPTGSGMGGYVLSLWNEDQGAPEGMISLNPPPKE